MFGYQAKIIVRNLKPIIFHIRPTKTTLWWVYRMSKQVLIASGLPKYGMIDYPIKT